MSSPIQERHHKPLDEKVEAAAAVWEFSVVFIPSDILNIIEGIGAVAKEALVYGGMLLAGDHSVHHNEMHHIMTWRCLVALRAFLGRRRRMQELSDSPRIQGVTAGAIAPKQAAMRLTIAVTVGAIETCLFRLVRNRQSQEFLQIGHHLFTDRARRSVGALRK